MSKENSVNPEFINILEKYQKYFPLIIVLFALVLFFFNLGSIGFLGPDEPRYAQVAREMFERHDFVTPTLLGRTWFEKPALLYWLIIGFYHLLDPCELAARLPNAMFATANLLIIYKIAKRTGDSIYGVFSSLVLATSGLFFALARATSFDMPLTFSFTAAISAFYLADTEKEKRNFYLILFYGAVGISMLAKGLVGIVLIGAIIGTYIILTGQLRNILNFRPFLGLVIFLLVISTWYIPVTLQHGKLFIDEFFIQHHFQRFTSNRYHHPGPIYFFILVILGGVFPWSIFLLKAVKQLFQIRPTGLNWFNFQDKQKRLLLLATLWLIIPLAFFSLSSSKLPGYILPVFPAVALLIGYELKKVFSSPEDFRYPLIITSILLLALGLALPYLASKQLAVNSTIAILPSSIPIIISLILIISLLAKRSWIAIFSLFCLNPILVLIITITLFPALETKDSLVKLSNIALKNLQPKENILFFNYLQYSPLFYTNGRIFKGSGKHTEEALVLNNSDELAKTLEQNSSLLCLTKEAYLNQITSDNRLKVSVIDKQRDIVLLRISLN